MAEKSPQAKALRGVPATELVAQREKLRREIWQSRIKTAEGAQPQTHRVRVMRRQIARIETVLRETARSGQPG